MKLYNPCFLVPCYNHGSTVARVIDSLQSFSLPIVLVDDGSNLDTQKKLEKQSSRTGVNLVRLAGNQGKGGAVMAGIRYAQSLGYSHVIQIDADGQHDIKALPALINASKQYPNKLISGKPTYDNNVPKPRLYGRYITHIWVWIETLSFTIKDSMCGFRVYPVLQTVDVINKYNIGRRMDFDIEILVRMYWEGVDIEFINVQVLYPENGVSHFDVLRDNLKISLMHTKLFLGMLVRAPKLLMRKISRQPDSLHWSKRQERGTILGIKILLKIYQLLGRYVFGLFLPLVIAYYYLVSKSARMASRTYLQQLKKYAIQKHITLPKHLNSYQHLLSFGHTMLDKLAAWNGDISVNDLTIEGQDIFDQIAEKKQGGLMLGSHLGNLELCRALSRRRFNTTINALVFTEHAENFNAVMKAINPSSELNLIQVSSLGADTAILLQQKIEQGQWVVIMGDRTSATHESRSVWVDFLGKPAPFPQGAFVLASALKVPVYLLFGLRDESKVKPHFNVYFEHFSEQIMLPRKNRQAALNEQVQRYANRLEHYVLKTPLQWYNFFDFWSLTSQQYDNKE